MADGDGESVRDLDRVGVMLGTRLVDIVRSSDNVDDGVSAEGVIERDTCCVTEADAEPDTVSVAYSDTLKLDDALPESVDLSVRVGDTDCVFSGVLVHENEWESVDVVVGVAGLLVPLSLSVFFWETDREMVKMLDAEMLFEGLLVPDKELVN